MKHYLALVATLASSSSAFALTFAGATENLLYFEYARLGADYCEGQGFPAREIQRNWQAKHEPLHWQSIQTVRAEGARRGLTTATEQDALLVEIMRPVTKTAQARVDGAAIPCTKFGRLIEGFGADFKR
jgi:hypothetical protein